MTSFIIYVLIITGIYGILALSLSLQYGVTGLVNLGQVAFFMVGAYASTILVLVFHLPIAVGFIGAIVAGGLFGVLMALPIGNLRQDYWAITTLAAAELARLVFLNTPIQGPYVGASYGVPGIPGPFKDQLTGKQFELFYLGLVALCVIAAYGVAVWVTRAPFGRVLKALREGDEVPLALGKPVRSLRVRAMAIGGAMAGAAGSLYAHYNGFIAPNYFLPLETFLIWSMVMLGGSGNHAGALLGTLIIELIYNSTRFLSGFFPGADDLLASLRMVVIGVLIIVVILYLPRGLAPERKRIYGRRDAS